MNALVPVGSTPAMTVSDVERVALAIAKGGLFGSKDPNAVLTLCLLAQAEGQHPAVVFRDYHIISGKPAKKAEAMLRDFINAGGKVKWHTLDDSCADATFTHPSGEARIEWTLERAKQAGISTAMWSKYPRQMLRSRVISEGIRTVYPGATSGLYEEGEVRAMTNTPEPEAIEGETVDRQKVPGIHKIKDRLRDLMNAGAATDSLEAFNTLVGNCKDDLQTIKDANHEWWTGDGEDFEGFRSFIKRRRDELAPFEPSENFTMCLESLETCTSTKELDAWFKLNAKYVETLDGEEGRRIQTRYDELEAGLKAAEVVRA